MKKYRMRLVLYVLLLVCTLGILGFSCFGYWQKIYQNRKLRQELENKYQQLVADEERLENEVTKLQDPEYAAQIAREKYYYSKDNELIIKFPDES